MTFKDEESNNVSLKDGGSDNHNNIQSSNKSKETSVFINKRECLGKNEASNQAFDLTTLSRGPWESKTK